MGSPETLQTDGGRCPAVLIVDDDEYVHGALEAALRGLHLRLLTARTAEEGERLALEHAPVLAIVDVGLPDRDGYALTSDLRRRGLSATRILILTGHATDEAAARDAGADGLIGKPFRLHQFLDLVRGQLGHRQQPEPVEAPVELAKSATPAA